MIGAETFNSSHISQLLNTVERNHLPYNEYVFLNDSQLLEFFKNQLLYDLSKSNISFIAVKDSQIVGFVVCELNGFDTEMFDLPSYVITRLIVFSKDFSEIKEITSVLISAVELKVKLNNDTVYLITSLNNNVVNQDKIFNSLISNDFYYIHTLLTFKSTSDKFETQEYYPKENMFVRKAELRDVQAICDIAKKSFKYSRFHLDPFLDSNKASILLGKSAKNAIMNNFVDIMFVAEINKTIVGYYSAKKNYIPEFDKTFGSAVISAVNEEYRGLGVFSKLDSHLINWFSDNTDFSEMGTYLVNYPVHKTWINKGLGLVRGVHQLSKLISN